MKVETLLRGSDPRSLAGVTRVIDEVLHERAELREVVDALEHDDAIVRMRAADALEKLTREDPELLEPFREALLRLARTTPQASLRWHLAQMVPRLALATAERRAMVTVFRGYLDDPSAIVRSSAMQAITEFAIVDRTLRRSVLALLRKIVETGTPAMRVRGGKLLQVLDQQKTRRKR